MKKNSKIDTKQKKQILTIILDSLMLVGLFGIFVMMFSGVGAFIEHFFDKEASKFFWLGSLLGWITLGMYIVYSTYRDRK